MIWKAHFKRKFSTWNEYWWIVLHNKCSFHCKNMQNSKLRSEPRTIKPSQRCFSSNAYVMMTENTFQKCHKVKLQWFEDVIWGSKLSCFCCGRIGSSFCGFWMIFIILPKYVKICAPKVRARGNAILGHSRVDFQIILQLWFGRIWQIECKTGDFGRRTFWSVILKIMNMWWFGGGFETSN